MNTWLQIESSLPDHRKTINFASMLKVNRVQAVGMLVCIWLWALNNRIDGRLKLSDAALMARQCDYKGKPDKLLQTMVMVGLLDDLDNGEYEIHDWYERTQYLIDLQEIKREQAKMRMRKMRQARKERAARDMDVEESESNSEEASQDRNTRVTVTRNSYASYAPTQHRQDIDTKYIANAANARARMRACIDRALSKYYPSQKCEKNIDELIEQIPPNTDESIVTEAILRAAHYKAANVAAYVIKTLREWERRGAKTANELAEIELCEAIILGTRQGDKQEAAERINQIGRNRERIDGRRASQ